MDELITWLRAQLDDDERVAQSAAQLAKTQDWWASAEGKVNDANAEGYRNLLGGENAWSLDEIGEHIANWDPARVLAEVEAKRRVLDWFAKVDRYMDRDDMSWHRLSGAVDCDEAIKLLAQPYAGRDGWREEWRP